MKTNDALRTVDRPMSRQGDRGVTFDDTLRALLETFERPQPPRPEPPSPTSARSTGRIHFDKD